MAINIGNRNAKLKPWTADRGFIGDKTSYIYWENTATVTDFPYTWWVQMFLAKPWIHKLRVWGAAWWWNPSYPWGKWWYSEWKMKVSRPTNLYVYVWWQWPYVTNWTNINWWWNWWWTAASDGSWVQMHRVTCGWWWWTDISLVWWDCTLSNRVYIRQALSYLWRLIVAWGGWGSNYWNATYVWWEWWGTSWVSCNWTSSSNDWGKWWTQNAWWAKSNWCNNRWTDWSFWYWWYATTSWTGWVYEWWWGWWYGWWAWVAWGGWGSWYVVTENSYKPSWYSVPENLYLKDAETKDWKSQFLSPDWTLETGHAWDWHAIIESEIRPVVPDVTYVTQSWVYHNPTLWLISISADWQNWITISDKNIGATVADPEDINSNWDIFQYWNTHHFAWDWSGWTVTTEAQIPDLTGYEWWNLYSDDKYRTNIDWNAANKNLWKWIAFNLKSLGKWPCPLWFHVPSAEEWTAVMDTVLELAWESFSYDLISKYLLMVHPNSRKWDWAFYANNTSIYLTNSYIANQNKINAFVMIWDEWSESGWLSATDMNCWWYIRPFRDEVMIPTTEWIRLWASDRPRLPIEYQELEYIENTSTSIIDTWLKTWIWYRIQLKFYTSSSSTADQTIIWWSTNTSAEAIYFWLNYASNRLSIYRWYNGSWFDADNSISVWNYYEAESLIRNWEQKLTLNWTVLYTGSAALSWTGSENMIIFNRRSYTTYPALIKLYYTKIYDVNDELVRDFVPCFRKSDWEPWMYDLVTDTFFTNAWTGRFLMWRDIAYLPEEYEQVEYVLNTTWEEHIDLWLVGNNTLKVSFLLMPTYLNNDNGYIWWIWSSNDFLLTTYQSKFRMHNGWNYVDTATTTINTLYDLRIDNAWITINWGKYNLPAWTNYPTHNLWIYQVEWQTTSTAPRFRTYWLRIWNQWEFVRDYVPCIRKSDGAVWFYDLVNGIFHTNQGGGAFVRWRIYSAYEVNSNTISYFPLCDEKDVTWERTLTLWNVTFPDGYANVNARNSYLVPSVPLWWSVITVSLFYYCQSLNSNSWNTLLCRNSWTYHHLLISWGNSDEGTVWKVWFWNNHWVGGNKIITPWKRYHFVVTKNWTNEKIYVNGELALDSNDSRDNNTYQLSIFWWHSNSSWDQWSIWKLSEFIAESRERTQEEVVTYLNTMKNYYWIS